MSKFVSTEKTMDEVCESAITKMGFKKGDSVKLRPLLNRILVKPLEADDTSTGGIFLPQTARDEMMQQGLVVEVGEGLPTTDGERVVPCKVKKGDKVLFQKYAGSEVTVEGVLYLLIPEGNILAVME